MSNELQVVSKALADIDAVSAGLSLLREKYHGVVYEVATIRGMEAAKTALRVIREPRYDVEKIRKDAKKPILDLGRKLDAEAARITSELLALEEPIHQQIKTENDRKEVERQAAVAAENKRIADLQARVQTLRGDRTLSAHSGSKNIATHITALDKIPVDESFQEFQMQAEEAKESGFTWLNACLSAAIAYEEEQKRLKAEREELTRLRAEQARRESEERSRQEAEAAKERESLRIQRDAQEAENNRVRAEQAAVARAERDRIAAEERRLDEERAEFQRQQHSARLVREAEEKERAEQARLANMKRPEDAEFIGVLAKHYRVPDSKVIEWLAATNWKKAKAA